MMNLMDAINLPSDELADIACVFFAGETDFKERVLQELRRLEQGERRLMRGCVSADARRYRERADAIKGALSFIERLEPKGRDVELSQRVLAARDTDSANDG